MIKIKTLSTAVAFFVAVAPVFAQDERGPGSRYVWEQMAASSATRSAINGVGSGVKQFPILRLPRPLHRHSKADQAPEPAAPSHQRNGKAATQAFYRKLPQLARDNA
jgi:hypothetical protein